MAKNAKIGSGEYTRSYSHFKGVDLCGGSISNNRLSFCENMYRDYEGHDSEAIESIPGFRKILSVGERINGIYIHKTYESRELMLTHAAESLYLTDITDGYSGEYTKIASLANTKSAGFTFGDYFYLLDGEKILRIDKDGGTAILGTEDAAPYIPTLYHNGEPLEVRNLLSDKFTEEYEGVNASELAYKTPELIYRVTDSSLLLCEVCGVEEGFTGELYIPGSVKIGDAVYKVDKIANDAFKSNLGITAVTVGFGIRCIGKNAFYCNSSLKRAIISDSVSEIQFGAFYSCGQLRELYLGSGISELNAESFTHTNLEMSVYYAGSEESFTSVAAGCELKFKNLIFDHPYTAIKIELPIHADAISVESVKIDDGEVEFSPTLSGELVSGVTLEIAHGGALDERRISILGTLRALKSSFSSAISDSEEDSGLSGVEAICGCRIAELYDGRLFLSGNARLPNTVFYTARDKNGISSPAYFGAMNYFNDGLGRYPVVSLLAVRDSLAVFKGGDDGSGSIFYHTPTETGDDLVPKIYPVSSVHSGLVARGGSRNFLDDPVFLCSLGLSALETNAINLERSVVTRSHNVNFDLLREDLENASLTEWLGYLVIGCRGKIYLADSRSSFIHESGAREYEWFILNRIGTYQGDCAVYVYDSLSQRASVKVSENAESPCPFTVYSESDERGSYYFSLEDGVKYALRATEERSGGKFYPAEVFYSDGARLYFGNECGDVCIFNNDLRGKAPEWLSEKEDFSAEEYSDKMADKIHPSFYSFASHAPIYAVKTAFDDCSVPHLAKSTVKHSLVVKCKSASGGMLSFQTGTDRRGFSEPAYLPASELDFTELDFSRMTFFFGEYFTVPLKEKEKGWVEKQIAVYSSEFNSPIGIYSISYRYTIKGKIKSN